MSAAPLIDVKKLSLLWITLVAAGCASHSRGYEPVAHAYVSPSAPHPLNVEPARHGAIVDPHAPAVLISSAGSPAAPHPLNTVPPAHVRLHADHAVPADAPPASVGASTIPPPRSGLAAPIDPGAPDPVPVREAVAVLVPTRGSTVGGVVRFRDDGNTLDVIASVDGLPGRVHAYHVHVYGNCASPDGASAGPHFHFAGSSFDKETPIITGNLGELRPDGRSTTLHRARIAASLHGPFSIIGRSVVVHELGNDPTSPPDGAAGKRLACGVIGVGGPTPAAPATALRP